MSKPTRGAGLVVGIVSLVGAMVLAAPIPAPAGEDGPRGPTPGLNAIPAGNRAATQELAAHLDIARMRLTRVKDMHERNIVSQGEVDEAEGQVRLLEARAAGMAGDLEEELELLKVRLSARKAVQSVATFVLKSAELHLDQSERAKKENQLGSGPVLLSQAELGRVKSELEVRAAETQEVEVRIRQVERRLIALIPLLKGTGPAAVPDPGPASPPPPPTPR
jgi:hypothetical protein